MQKIVVLFAVVALAACKAVPVDHAHGYDVIASEGVLAEFADPSIDAIATGGAIRCTRHKRVGTHMITKVCMTRTEWEELAKQSKDDFQNRMSGVCGATQQVGEVMNSDLNMALLPTACGETINR